MCSGLHGPLFMSIFPNFLLPAAKERVEEGEPGSCMMGRLKSPLPPIKVGQAKSEKFDLMYHATFLVSKVHKTYESLNY